MIRLKVYRTLVSPRLEATKKQSKYSHYVISFDAGEIRSAFVSAYTRDVIAITRYGPEFEYVEEPY